MTSMPRSAANGKRASTASAASSGNRTADRQYNEYEKGGRSGRPFFCFPSPYYGETKRRSLRRDAHFRRRRLDVGRDVIFELGEVLLEHADQIARGLVELRLILPGLERVEQMRLDARH